MFLYPVFFSKLNNYITSFLQPVYLSLLISLELKQNTLNYEDVAQPKPSCMEIVEIK